MSSVHTVGPIYLYFLVSATLLISLYLGFFWSSDLHLNIVDQCSSETLKTRYRVDPLPSGQTPMLFQISTHTQTVIDSILNELSLKSSPITLREDSMEEQLERFTSDFNRVFRDYLYTSGELERYPLDLNGYETTYAMRNTFSEFESWELEITNCPAKSGGYLPGELIGPAFKETLSKSTDHDIFRWRVAEIQQRLIYVAENPEGFLLRAELLRTQNDEGRSGILSLMFGPNIDPEVFLDNNLLTSSPAVDVLHPKFKFFTGIDMVILSKIVDDYIIKSSSHSD